MLVCRNAEEEHVQRKDGNSCFIILQNHRHIRL